MKLGRWRRAAGWILATLILFFMAQLLFTTWNRTAATGFEFRFNLPLLAVSLVLLVLERVFAVEAWRRILWALGQTLSYRLAYRAWFFSNLARYVPGNVWQIATLMVLLERYGVPRRVVLLSQIVYTGVTLSIAGLLGLALLPLSTNLALVAAILFGAAVLLLAQPRVFDGMIRAAEFLLYRWRNLRSKDAPDDPRLPVAALARPHLTFARGLLPPLAALGGWACNGVGFFLFVRSLADLSLTLVVPFTAIYAASYFLGYLSFVTPSGLGFREGAMAFLLLPYFPTPVALAIALAARLWVTAGELLSGALALWPALPSAAQAIDVPSSR